jgi:hypothetical protein
MAAADVPFLCLRAQKYPRHEAGAAPYIFGAKVHQGPSAANAEAFAYMKNTRKLRFLVYARLPLYFQLFVYFSVQQVLFFSKLNGVEPHKAVIN